MRKSELLILIFIIIVVLSVMYATQPLQPLLANEFDINVIQASQFTAVIMFSLAIAPIFYGYILESVCAKKMLKNASIILLITNICLALSDSYLMFLIIRTIESLVIPAILTSIMSILASTPKEEVKFNMSIYVASTVFGGLVGRIISGYIASYFGWQMVFYSLSFALFIAYLLISKLSFEGEAKLTKPKIKDVVVILKDGRFIVIYFLMFVMFFAFGGVLNLIPFHVKELIPDISESGIGLLYLGYGMGIVVSLLSKKIVKIFKNEANTILAGGVIFTTVIFSFYSTNVSFIFFMLFLYCVGMFTVHTVSTGIANSLKESQKSLTAGMYLTFYYIGGASGSIIPAIIYHKYGWDSTITLFIFMLIFAYVVFYINRKRF